MAKLPQNPNQFSNYYQQFLPGVSTGAAAQASSGYPKRDDEPNEMGFLGRLVDIASRPLRFISNPVMKALELPDKLDALAIEEAAGGEVSFGEKIAPVGNLLASPFTGFLSDKDENKPYWSDIVEQVSDTANRNDPAYVDVQDNVNPVAKGTLGFIGDVVLDPLSWIPGVGFVKVGAKSAQLYNKIGKATGITAAGKAMGKVTKTVAEKVRGPKAPTTVEETAPASFEVFWKTSNSKGQTQVFDTVDDAKQFIENKISKSKSKSPWVELAEGQGPAGRANGYRISQKNKAIPDDVANISGGVKDDVPAGAIGAEIVQATDNAVAQGDTATEAIEKTLSKIVKSQKLSDGTPLTTTATKFISDLTKPKFETAAQAKKAAVAAQEAVRRAAPSLQTWVLRTRQEIADGTRKNQPVKLPENTFINPRAVRDARSIKTLGQALEAYLSSMVDQQVRAELKKVLRKNHYLPDIKNTTPGKTPTAASALIDDEMIGAVAVRQTDEIKDASPNNAVNKALRAKSLKKWGAVKDAWIAKNKKRLKLPVVKYDFNNPVASTRAPEIARTYNELVSAPNDPLVKRAYASMVKEAREHYEYMTKELGIKIEFVDYDPYNVKGVPNSANMIKDVLENKRLLVRSSKIDPPHPLMSNEENDIFRAVHEFFGHAASGSTFRASGEEAAWVSHSSMFSPEARRAMTTETRGQNSFYNYFDPTNKNFAEQKAALFPQEFVELPTAREIAAGGKGERALTLIEKLVRLDEESMTVAEMVFGPTLLADLKTMQDAKLNLFFDNVRSILAGSGIVPLAGAASKGSMQKRLLDQFGLTEDALASVRAEYEAKVVKLAVEPPKNVTQAVKDLPQDTERVTTLRNEMSEIAPIAAQTDEYADEAIKAIQGTWFEVAESLFSKEWIQKNLPNLIKNGRYRSDSEFGVGVGRNLEESNTHVQFTFALKLSMRIEKLFEGPSPKFLNAKGTRFMGTELATKQSEFFLSSLRVMEDILENKGIPMVIDNPQTGEIVAMRFSDIIDAIKAGLASNAADLAGLERGPLTADIEWYKLIFHNANTGAAWTKIIDAVSDLIRLGDSATPDDVLAIVTSTSRRNLRKDGVKEEIYNWLGTTGNENKMMKMGFLPSKSKELVSKYPGIEYKPNGKGTGFYVEYDREIAAAKLADALFGARTALKQISDARQAKMLQTVETEIGQVSPEIAANFVRLATDPQEAAATIRMASELGTAAKDFGKTINAYDASIVASAGLVRAALGERSANLAEYTARMADKVKDQDLKGAAAARKNVMDESDTAVKDVDEGVQKLVDEGFETNDPQTRAMLGEVSEQVRENNSSASGMKESAQGYAEMQSGRMSLLEPVFRFFNAKYGMNTKEYLWAWMTYHGQGIALRDFVNSRVIGLNKLGRKYNLVLDAKGTSVVNRAFQLIQKGVRPTASEPQVLAAWGDLMRHVGKIFDTSPDAVNSVLGNQFLRTGQGVEYANDVLGSYRVLGDNVQPPNGVYFNLEEARAAAKISGRDVMEEAAEQWRTWPIKDPVEFLAKLNAAAGRMAADTTFVDKFIARAGDYGLTSSKKAPGFVKLRPEGESRYGRLIPGDKEVYVTPEVADIFKRIDEVSQESRVLTSDFGKFLNRTLDPITNTWKYAITLPRPGHHFRNLVGDLSFTYFAEGLRHSLEASDDAFKLLSLRNNYDDVDILRVLTNRGINIPQGRTVISKGGYGDLTAEELFEAAKKRGLMPPAVVIEDLYDADIVAGKFSKALETGAAVASLGMAARGGRAEKIVMGISEYRDHFARLQHFMQVIRKAQSGEFITRGIGNVVKPKTKQELFDVAGERVLKFHPDVSQLASSEAKYMRRLIPFYSWTRGAVTALAESVVMAPARLMVPNKASYNIAVATGIDPNSLYDPFPDDQLFPSFLSEEMQGPQFEVGGRYYGISPGIASWDVFNMLGPDPIRGIVGATNPLLRGPIELLAGSSLGTGARIRDISDYVDSSIPGVNYISSISGQSVTGTLASLLTGGGFDPQYQYAAGNKEDRDKAISFFNYLTGIGIKDYSRPNYINYAEIEARNKAAKEGNRNR